MNTDGLFAVEPDSLTPARAVVVMTSDEQFATQLAEILQARGGWLLRVATAGEFVAALDQVYPLLAVLDLDLAGDWHSALTLSKLKPHTRSIPLYCFYRTFDQQLIASAQQAGADEVWPRTRLVEQLAQLVRRQQEPLLRYPAGWDEPLSAEAQAGVDAFNAGNYFEQHEHFEQAWMAEPRSIRELYQGLLQVGLAFYQIQRDNWAGALKMFRRGLPRLKGLPAVCQGLQIAHLRSAAEAIHLEISELGPAGLSTFDQRKFPRIEVVGSPLPDQSSLPALAH
ncbi:MAG TPA: DUF309 domain-containing protein [Caldilineaceae bacterium]|nr:DUF309 domain-containing protein [Caldilineaceae bacterium]